MRSSRAEEQRQFPEDNAELANCSLQIAGRRAPFFFSVACWKWSSGAVERWVISGSLVASLVCFIVFATTIVFYPGNWRLKNVERRLSVCYSTANLGIASHVSGKAHSDNCGRSKSSHRARSRLVSSQAGFMRNVTSSSNHVML